jgi:hypothetical protein
MLDLAFDPPSMKSLREFAQKLGIDASVEVIGVIDINLRCDRKLLILGGLVLEAVFPELGFKLILAGDADAAANAMRKLIQGALTLFQRATR